MRTEKQHLNDENDREEKRPMTRVELHGKKYRKKKQRSGDEEKKKRSLSIPSVLLVILLLLPVTVSLVAKGGKLKTEPGHTSGERVQINSNEGLAGVAVTAGKPSDEKASAAEPEKETPSTPVEKEQSAELSETSGDEKPAAAGEAEKEQSQQNRDENAGAVYHTVQPGETLYRIAMNYYKSKDGVDKIRSANGLGGNEIRVGQKLVIPE